MTKEEIKEAEELVADMAESVRDLSYFEIGYRTTDLLYHYIKDLQEKAAMYEGLCR